MSIAPIAPIGPAAAALGVKAVNAVEAEVMVTLDAMMAPSVVTPGGKPAPKPQAPQPTLAQQAVNAARADAAGRQASSAPLYADAAQVRAAPTLPPAVKAAIGQLLALRIPLGGPLTAQTIRQAVAQSGLFLEAHLSQALPGEVAKPDIKAALATLQRVLAAVPAAPSQAQAPGPAATPAPASRPAANPPQAQGSRPSAQPAAPPTLSARDPGPVIVQQLTRQIAQVPARPTLPQLAPLFADLATVEAAPALPPAVKAAIGQVLGLPAPLAGPIPPQTLRRVLAQPAAILEAQLRQAPPTEPAPAELRAALATLQRALAGVPSAPDAPASRPSPTAPPVREATLSAQPAVLPTLSARDPAPVIVQHLAAQADQAMARQTLHQLASLPDGPTPAWMFELPVATPQGTAVAQFEIERDGQGADAGDQAQAWRVRFSIDIEPLGPVQVQLRLDGDRAAVTVWAEREEGLQRLRSLGGELSRALPAEVIFHPGAPRRPLPESGQFVDQTS